MSCLAIWAWGPLRGEIIEAVYGEQSNALRVWQTNGRKIIFSCGGLLLLVLIVSTPRYKSKPDVEFEVKGTLN